MHFAFLFGEFTVPTTSGPVCPPVVGISNSPKMRGNHTMFPPGGHMGPPLQSNTKVVYKQAFLRCQWVCRLAEH